MGDAENRTFCRLNPEASEGKTELRECCRPRWLRPIELAIRLNINLRPTERSQSKFLPFNRTSNLQVKARSQRRQNRALRVAALRRGWLRADIGRTLHKILRFYEKPQSAGNRYLQPGSSAERHRAPAAGSCGPPAGTEPYIRNRRVNYTSVGDRRLFFLRPLMPRARFFRMSHADGVLAFLGGQESKPRTRRECAIPSRPQDVRSEYRPLENSETVRVLLPLFRRTTCPSGTPKPRTVPTQQAARAEPLFRPGRVPSSADRSPSFPATALNRNRSPARTGPHKARCRDPRRNPRRNGWTKRRSPHE